jgi:hypothetical protein
MAASPSHKFGQLIGELLESILGPQLQEFCDKRDLYLDKKGARGAAREGRKVTWADKYGNGHDLDFVIEQGGTKDKLGRPLAFIEAAWRRYTKHSRNKAQEIQGAILPIAEKHAWDKPFLGAVLAGVFTDGSLTQIRSSGFEVILFPYESIVDAFKSIKINAAFDEDTADAEFQKTVDRIEKLNRQEWIALREHLVKSNAKLLEQFLKSLQSVLDRRIESVVTIPLHGGEVAFATAREAIAFVEKYNEKVMKDGLFRKYEIIVKYSNGDKIDAEFSDKKGVVDFLNYVAKA